MKPLATIDVMGLRASLRLSAVIDTGFDGELSLPTDVAIGLGLELRAKRRYVLADGSLRSELAFSGKVRFLNEERDVEILLTDHDEALLGTGLMDECRLTIDFAKETVDLRRSNKKGATALSVLP